MTASDLSPGDVIAGKYKLDRLVGRGGMGSVWAARNEQLGMLVALKFIESVEGADAEDARARFEREARAAARIRSPHVAQIFEHVSTGDRPFIAMELLEGEDLGERLRREGRITVPAASKILTQASKALRRAHDAGIIHRDLKPGNVYLARFDDDEVVKILDFGVAKVLREGGIDGPLATQTGIVFGSPSYMSPEQARGVRALDHRSDLWSMAVIMFRAITGVKPFQGNSIGDLVVKLCIDPLPVATSFSPELSPEIDRFFERAFARDPDRRFQSAVDMAAAFEAIGAGLAPRIEAQAPASFRPMPRIPVQELPPAPPLAPLSGNAPGSGPHVGFASGTLTPPPGTAPDMEAGPRSSARAPVTMGETPKPPAQSVPMGETPKPPARPVPSRPAYDASQEATAVRPGPMPSFQDVSQAMPVHDPTGSAMAPQFAIAPPITPSNGGREAGAPQGPAGAPSPFVGAQTNSRHLAIGAGIGLGALVLLVFMIAIAAKKSGGDPPARPAASAVATSPDPAPPAQTATAIVIDEPPPAPSAIETASAASAAPVPSAAPEVSAEPAVTAAPSASAEPDSSASPRVRTKPGKKRPNFGY